MLNPSKLVKEMINEATLKLEGFCFGFSHRSISGFRIKVRIEKDKDFFYVWWIDGERVPQEKVYSLLDELNSSPIEAI